MKRARALFVSRRTLELGGFGQGPTGITGWLRDYAARGYRIIVITDKLELGDRVYTSPRDMLNGLCSVERHTLPIADVVVLTNAYDPSAIWDAARRFALDLNGSIFVTETGEHSSAVRNAGVRQTESPKSLGMAA